MLPQTDFWRDPLFLVAGLGVIVTLLAGIISAILTYWFSLRLTKKEIAYIEISDTPVVSVNEKMENRVKIFVDDTPVNNASLLAMKVWNSGKTAVKSEDYYEPITFEFEGGEVHTVDVEPKGRIDPKNIKIVTPNSVVLPGFFLNPNELINLTILLSGHPSKIEGKAGIVNGHFVKSYARAGAENRLKRDWRINIIIYILSFIFACLFLFGFYVNEKGARYDPIPLTLLVLTVFIAPFIWFFILLLIKTKGIIGRLMTKIRKIKEWFMRIIKL